MSPDDIPGTILKFLHRLGTKKCPKCGQTYGTAKLKRNKGIIYKVCPNPACNNVLSQYSLKEAEKMAAKRGK